MHRKRRNGNLLAEINTSVNELLGVRVDQSRKIFMSHMQSVYTVCLHGKNDFAQVFKKLD